jgi:hypothetical protein
MEYFFRIIIYEQNFKWYLLISTYAKASADKYVKIDPNMGCLSIMH